MYYNSADIQLTSTQIAWATAVPVILGSFLRIPIGYWTNRFGARLLFTLSFMILVVPIALISYANSLSMLIFGAILLGIGSAVFSIGVTSLPKYFPNARHGVINGIYGIGNIGTVITSFLAPVLANEYGWRTAFDGVFVTDVTGIIERVNPAFTKITGYTQEEVIGKTPSVLQSGEHNNAFYKRMWDSLSANGFWEGYIWNKRKNQEIYQEWLTITAIMDEGGDTKNYVGIFKEKSKK